MWTTAWVKAWTEVTAEMAGEINSEVVWHLNVHFKGENRAETSFEPGSLVKSHGLQSAAGQSNNGRFVVVSKPLKKASTGRLPVLNSDESSGGLKFLLIKPENLQFVRTRAGPSGKP
jgi:hypothetical protein